MSIHTVRSSKLSLFQSMVEDYVLGTHPRERTVNVRPTLRHPMVAAAAEVALRLHRGEALRGAPPPPTLTAQAGATTAWECARLAGELLVARLEGRHEDAVRLEDELSFSSCDPRWLEVIAEYLEHYGPGTHHTVPYVTYTAMDDFVLDVLDPDATVAIIGDWGTGTDEAVELLDHVARSQPDCLVHLGDIYYSGTAREAHSHFLARCDQVLDRPARQVPIYTLSGNHDMYSGGHGYYGLLPHLNPPEHYGPGLAQPASFFSLRTRDKSWQLLAMDTGLNDRDPFTVTTDVTYLEDSEAKWHLDKIARFSQEGGRTILLSHHQLFSPFDYIGTAAKPAGQEAYNPRLLETFAGALDAGQVAAWFWGHEHNLGIYEPYGSLAKGRCVGHAAIPVFGSNEPYSVDKRIPDPPTLVKDSAGREVRLNVNDDGVYGHGYVILQLSGAGPATASYYVIGTDEPVYVESID